MNKFQERVSFVILRKRYKFQKLEYDMIVDNRIRNQVVEGCTRLI